MTNVRLTSRDRSERLTDHETVKLGRVLAKALAVQHVSYPDDTPTVVVVVHGYGDPLAAEVKAKVTEFLGDFDETVDHA